MAGAAVAVSIALVMLSRRSSRAGEARVRGWKAFPAPSPELCSAASHWRPIVYARCSPRQRLTGSRTSHTLLAKAARAVLIGLAVLPFTRLRSRRTSHREVVQVLATQPGVVAGCHRTTEQAPNLTSAARTM